MLMGPDRTGHLWSSDLFCEGGEEGGLLEEFVQESAMRRFNRISWLLLGEWTIGSIQKGKEVLKTCRSPCVSCWWFALESNWCTWQED